MTLQLIDLPLPVKASLYEEAIERVVETLSHTEGVIGIYQVGTVTHPGISDVDLLVVFEDQAAYLLDPLRRLGRAERYLFTHQLFYLTVSQIRDAQKMALFKPAFLWGTDVGLGPEEIHADLRCQIALEYLIRLYMTLSIQIEYRVIRWRGFLLQVKALRRDLELLGISSGALYAAIEQVCDLRKHWFFRYFDDKTLLGIVESVYRALTGFLESILHVRTFYVPERSSLEVSRNIRLANSCGVGYRRCGRRLPSVLRRFGRRYFSLQHRLNLFEFRIPFQMGSMPADVASKYHFVREAKMKAARSLPYFQSMVIGLVDC